MRILNMPIADAALQQLIDEALATVPVRPTARTREWFRVRAAADPPAPDQTEKKVPPPDDPESVVDIDIYSDIGSWYDGLTAKDFIDALGRLPANVKTIRVHVNSLGGDVYDALAITNALQRHPASIEMLIEGVAASAATIVTQGAGNKVKIADNALVMIHDPGAYLGGGTAKDLRGAANMLDRVKAAIVTTYQRLSPLATDALASMMEASTWMDASEALANGFATEIVSNMVAVTASASPRVLASISVPEKYKAAFDAAAIRPSNDLSLPEAKAPAKPPTADAGEVMRACAAAGLDLAFTQSLVGNVASGDLAARVAAETATRAAATARATEIQALCLNVHLPELADGYVAGGMDAAQVRAHLLTITAKLDKVEIDAGLGPDDGNPRRQPVIDVRAVYAERNKPRS